MARKGRRSSKDERINAIRLLEQGYTKVQVARIFNVTESSVYGWQKAYREGGLAALSTKIASGRKRLLTDKQMLELSGYLRLNSSPARVQFRPVDQEAGPRADQGEIQDRLLGTERRPDPEDARLLPAASGVPGTGAG